MVDETRDYKVSGGNVFADAGQSDPDERLARARIMHRITVLIRDRGLTQREAAALLGVPQPHISLLLRGRMSSFSLERLLRMLTALGTDVTISYQASESTIGHLHIIGDEAADSDWKLPEDTQATVSG